MGKGKDSTTKNYTYVKRWRCDNCGLTNLNPSTDLVCPNPYCCHARCKGCEVFKVKVRIDC